MWVVMAVRVVPMAVVMLTMWVVMAVRVVPMAVVVLTMWVVVAVQVALAVLATSVVVVVAGSHRMAELAASLGAALLVAVMLVVRGLS